MTITEEQFKEMKNFRQLKVIPRDDNLLADIKIAIGTMDSNIIIKDFPLTEEKFYHPFAAYRKPAFQRPKDNVVNRLNTFISGMVAHWKLNEGMHKNV